MRFPHRFLVGAASVALGLGTVPPMVAAEAAPAPADAVAYVPDTWVATGVNDHYVIRIISGSRVEVSGPSLRDRTPGRQTVKPDGTIIWAFGLCEFTGRPVRNTMVMTAKGVPYPGKVVFTRADEATVNRTLTTLAFVNQGLHLALQLDTAPPRIIGRAELPYPPEMKRAGIEGSVTVRFEVNKLGLVVNAKVEKSTRKEFEAAALEGVRNSIFRPGIRKGKLVSTRLTQEVNFEITPPAAAPPDLKGR